ncbi:hypothetical protein RRG08_014224 [Elysia crispata]|uniref:Uncharacterized protein n=1 Tax=Elysia crispata TaxID=231223 RepID=A0AAE0XF58_9GAST|nr:hypothetical protein RRG08_014224 [Elysia crispata]
MPAKSQPTFSVAIFILFCLLETCAHPPEDTSAPALSCDNNQEIYSVGSSQLFPVCLVVDLDLDLGPILIILHSQRPAADSFVESRKGFSDPGSRRVHLISLYPGAVPPNHA